MRPFPISQEKSASSHQRGIGLEVVAEICGFLIPDACGPGFRALVMFCGIVELAVAAGVQVAAAVGAGVAALDAAARGVLNLSAAFPTRKSHHGD